VICTSIKGKGGGDWRERAYINQSNKTSMEKKKVGVKKIHPHFKGKKLGKNKFN